MSPVKRAKTPSRILMRTLHVVTLMSDDQDSDSEADIVKQETAPFRMLSCVR